MKQNFKLTKDQQTLVEQNLSIVHWVIAVSYTHLGDSQVVWVKWHTPSTPQTVTITVSVSGAYTCLLYTSRCV